MFFIYLHHFSGMVDDQEITFHGEGDQEPGVEPGDIVIVLDEKEHRTFKRKGADLVMQMDIMLADALCGFTRVIDTLDKRHIVINTLPGECLFCPSNIIKMLKIQTYKLY